jgi:hypothetical protein
MRDHPELGDIVSSFNAKILKEKPSDTADIIAFAVQHFTKDIFEE